MIGLLVGGSLGVALLLLSPPRVRLRSGAAEGVDPLGSSAQRPVQGVVDEGWLHRHRLVWSLLAGVGAAVFVGGNAAPVAALAVAVGVWVVVGRAEPAGVRRRREAVRRDLPHVVTLLGAALRAGAAPTQAIRMVTDALPGPAADRLVPVTARLSLATDPAQVWQGLALDPDLAALGRCLGRAHVTGASVADAVARLGEDLARRARGDVEDRARAVGVKAAVPLGLCLLPAFVLLGIVPLVAGLLGSLAL